MAKKGSVNSMRSALSAVMFSGFTVNSMRLAKSAANSPENGTSTISTPGRPSRLANLDDEVRCQSPRDRWRRA